MAEVKSEEVDQDKQVQVAYALPYDVVFSVLGQLEAIKHTIINNAVKIEVKEKVD